MRFGKSKTKRDPFIQKIKNRSLRQLEISLQSSKLMKAFFPDPFENTGIIGFASLKIKVGL